MLRTSYFLAVCIGLIFWMNYAFSQQKLWEVKTDPTKYYAEVKGMSSNSRNEIFFFAENNLYRSFDNGDTWSIMRHDTIYSIYNDTDDLLYTGCDKGKIVMSTDFGSSWITSYTGSTVPILSICKAANGNLVAGSQRDGLFLSSDVGKSWQKIIDTGRAIYRNFYSAKIGKNQGVMFCTQSYPSSILRSTDYGLTWTSVYRNEIYSNNTYELVENDSGMLFTVNNINILKSVDNGMTWNELPLIPYRVFTSLVIGGNQHLYASTFTRTIFHSSDAGMTWAAFDSSGFDHEAIVKLMITPAGYLFAGTMRNLYRTTRSLVSVQENIPEPNDMNLSQNYPNPFSQMTNVEFGIRNELNSTLRTPHSAFSFKVYDIIGREVLDLSDQVKSNSVIKIHNSQLPYSGVYFYRLKIGNQSQMKKMIMVR